MTAPLSQWVRCVVNGHDWRRAIDPRQGFYLRCRRCWGQRQVQDAASDGQGWQAGEAQRA